MVDLTIFTLPKPFDGDRGIAQRNGIASWLRLGAHVAALCVSEADAAVAQSLGAEAQLGLELYADRWPYLPSVFALGEQGAPTETLAFIHPDNILMRDFAAAVEAVQGVDTFLMVGRRTDVEIDTLLDFDDPGWEAALRAQAEPARDSGGPFAMDYFVYRPRGLFGEIPPFVIGFYWFDNWLMRRAINAGVTTIDASAAVLCVHQKHPVRVQPDAAQAQENQRLTNGAVSSIDGASHFLTTAGELILKR